LPVTAGVGEMNLAQHYIDDWRYYNACMVKALADKGWPKPCRYLHETRRKEIWGFAAQENSE